MTPTPTQLDGGARDFLMGLELGITDFAAMRRHYENLGTSLDAWPKWAKMCEGNLTKSAKAEILFAEMTAIVPAPPEQQWARDDIQFPRLIAELEAAGAFADYPRLTEALGESMDLQPAGIAEIIERAVNQWDHIKENT